jgi:hypothetical protein
LSALQVLLFQFCEGGTGWCALKISGYRGLKRPRKQKEVTVLTTIRLTPHADDAKTLPTVCARLFPSLDNKYGRFPVIKITARLGSGIAKRRGTKPI